MIAGKELRELLRQKNINVKSLAKQLDIPYTTFQSWLTLPIPIPANEEAKQKIALSIGLWAYPGSVTEKVLRVIKVKLTFDQWETLKIHFLTK